MNLEDLDGAVILRDALIKEKRELGIVKNGGLILMTVEESVGPDKGHLHLAPLEEQGRRGRPGDSLRGCH